MSEEKKVPHHINQTKNPHFGIGPSDFSKRYREPEQFKPEEKQLVADPVVEPPQTDEKQAEPVVAQQEQPIEPVRTAMPEPVIEPIVPTIQPEVSQRNQKAEPSGEGAATAKMMPALVLKGVKRVFKQGSHKIEVLKGADLEIKGSEIVALVGPSGAGKSTLLHIAGLLEKPDEGEVYLGGKACGQLTDAMRTRFRREHLGFVYQHHNLLPEFSALENVLIPQMIGGDMDERSKQRAEWLLDRLGLSDRITHYPTELSGGEQQRVAVARALSNRPRLLLADEPTGNLDPLTSRTVFDELLRLVRETGLSALIATHNPELASRMDRQFTLQEGYLVEIGPGAMKKHKDLFR